MEAKIAGYLEEYARHLRIDFDALMDRCLNDRDSAAGEQSLELIAKIRDIRHIIKMLADTRTKHL